MQDAETADVFAHQLTADGWKPHEREGFIAHVGGFYQRECDGHVEFGLLTAEQHINRNGVVHGGMIMTFVDRAFGHVAQHASQAPRVATVSLSHSFVAPLRIGVFATVRPTITRMGGTLAFVEGTMMCEGETILTAQGVWRLARTGK